MNSGQLPAVPNGDDQEGPRNHSRTEVVARFFDVQERELEIKRQELELRKQEDSNGFEFAKKSLEVQERDRKHDREHFSGLVKFRWVCGLILAVLIVGIVVTALLLDKDQIAVEIVKAIVFLVAGAAGGYGVAKKGTSQSSSDEDDDSK